MPTTTITALAPYLDASGCPAVLVVDGIRFAADVTGAVVVRPLSERRASKKTLRIAEWLYRKALADAVDADWMARNAALYSI